MAVHMVIFLPIIPCIYMVLANSTHAYTHAHLHNYAYPCMQATHLATHIVLHAHSCTR